MNDKRIKTLNSQYRGVNSTTDVLSFPQIEKPVQYSQLKNENIVLGDIVINLHRTRRQAIEHGLTFYEELKKLLIHGLLHLINYNHEKGGYHKKRMNAKEKELLEVLKEL